VSAGFNAKTFTSTALATFVAGAAFVMFLSHSSPLQAAPLQAAPTPTRAPQTQLAAGEYVFNLAGCVGCHTDKKNGGARLAGGRAFKTDYGTFYAPNITPDADTGIGTWTFDQFRRAIREGMAPDGSHYFPAFPYTSYTHMTDQDLGALWTYLQAQPTVSQSNRAHDLNAPFNWRWLVTFWNALYLDQGPKPQWDRGRYLAEVLSHCNECHTPRTLLGGAITAMAFSGTPRNPEGITVPNITSDRETGIGKWKEGDFDMLFSMGMLPDGDFVSGVMSESVSHSTSKMTEADRKALIGYIRALPPVHNLIKAKK